MVMAVVAGGRGEGVCDDYVRGKTYTLFVCDKDIMLNHLTKSRAFYTIENYN
jgi:hypothetical protein